jgi:cytochrome c peroxidase
MLLPKSIATALALSATLAVSAPVPPEMQLAPLPKEAPQPAENPSTPAKVALGRLLFFDPILSATQDVACAVCHHPEHGWTDGRPVPIGSGGAGFGPERRVSAGSDFALLTRNAPTLLNVAFNGLVTGLRCDPTQAPMFWDNRVRSLETQALIPVRSREEMRGDVCPDTVALERMADRVRGIPEYRRQFATVFGADVSAEKIAHALACFERSLVTGNTAFDRFMRGEASALNATQQRGLRVFQDAGCIQCHGGPMFSDYKLHFIGITDPGPDGRRELRTPTLRQLRHTAPYMHNGSLRSIRDVLVFYEALSDAVSETLDGGDAVAQPPLDPLLKHLNLNADDFPALEAFLDVLSTDYDQTAPAAVPSGLPVPRAAVAVSSSR